MSLIRPFRALRPTVERVAQVAGVPYDVVNTLEAKQLADRNPWSFLHVSRPEIDLVDSVDPHSPLVYQKASTNFKEMMEKCPLIQDETPSLYLYRLKMGHYQQTGIVGTFSIDEYDSNQIKKHERTRADKEDDRTRHVISLSAQTGPVFLTYKDAQEIDHEMERITTSTPLYNFKTPDEITHTVWKIDQTALLVELFSTHVQALYIADGHHRAAAASRARTYYSSQNKDHQGTEDYNFVFAVAFPASQLHIWPYHRIVKDLNGLSPQEFLEQVSRSFEITSGTPTPIRRELSLYLEGQWHRLKPKSPAKEGLSFDVDLLQDNILGPILGIEDPRRDNRIEFVGGIRGTDTLERLVQSGTARAAFSVYPVKIEDVMAVADSNGIMPPKSTWFEPKLRDGIFSYKI